MTGFRLDGVSLGLRIIRTTTGWGVRLESGTADSVAFEQPLPVQLTIKDADDAEAHPYEDVVVEGRVLVASASVAVADATITVTDRWWLDGDDVHVRRQVEVRGTSDAAFVSRLTLRRAGDRSGWTDVVPFVPGVTYGDARQVADGALGGRPALANGVRSVLIREDRMAAPMFTTRYTDGTWLSVLHLDPDGATVAVDGLVENGGEILVDARLAYASLGGQWSVEGLDLGAWFPGTEGEYTYSTGGLPLGQPHAWRHRYHPASDGVRQDYHLVWSLGTTDGPNPELWSSRWRWAWALLRPEVRSVDLARVLRDTMAVLAAEVTTTAGRTGVPLEADAVTVELSDEDRSAVMGFVGANTDAGHLLLRVGDEAGGRVGAHYRRLGEAILDTFARIPLDPPVGEGFDTTTGDLTTYRSFRGERAVYARSIAEGCFAVLEAARWESERGTPRRDWDRWVRGGADWLIGGQRADGSLPRAWAAESGAELDRSPSATAVVVPFLVAVAATTGEAAYLRAAIRAGEWAWATYGEHGWWAGATLDNPDVVDKEAAMLAAEAFLDLHDATAEPAWLDRAVSAASVAETWIYLWDVPMPVDADDVSLHWKRDVPTTGHQLITTGASMTDGFLAVNAAAFARLWVATGDEHWLDVARLVTHGTTTMLASEDRAFDLRGPGWQQEHWCFGGRRGYGLNRRWLPWVPVAHVRGIVRLQALGAQVADRVLGQAE